MKSIFITYASMQLQYVELIFSKSPFASSVSAGPLCKRCLQRYFVAKGFLVTEFFPCIDSDSGDGGSIMLDDARDASDDSVVGFSVTQTFTLVKPVQSAPMSELVREVSSHAMNNGYCNFVHICSL